MSEEVKAVHREQHPFIGVKQVNHFVGRPVAFVGKIDRFEDHTMFMKSSDGKCSFYIGITERLLDHLKMR